MPIRRPSDNDPDWMAKKQDKELILLEERISALYEDANFEISEEFASFYRIYQAEYERRLQMVEDGELTQEEFATWSRNQIIRSNRYQATLRMLTDVLVNADVAAMALVNEQLPYTLAESYDFISSLGFEAADRAGISMGTFQIYNASSVQAIIRDNPDLLPIVDLPADQLWNRNHINTEITQAIIQGDSMPQIARRLQRVTQMDNNAAIRNARTSMTAAENLGRSESASRLRERGLPVEEVWSATHDSRTRNTHLLLDGTKKDKNGYFGVGIIAVPLRFPADPLGEPQEIYNCRCRDNVKIAGIDHSRDEELYEQFMRENYPEDWNELERRRADIHTGEGRREVESLDALDRQRRLRENRQSSATTKEEEQDINKTAYDILGNAYESHRINNELSSVSLEQMQDSPFNSVSVSYEHISEETASRINDALEMLTSEYDTPLCKISTLDASQALGNTAFATTRHNYNVDTAEIILNPMKMNDYEQMTDRIMELAERGYCPRIPPENAGEYIITHEFGHTILNMRDTLSNSQNWVGADYNTIRTARREINAIFEEYRETVGRLDEERRTLELEVIMGTANEQTLERAREAAQALADVKISNYSLVNVDEFLAESFANERLAYRSNPYAARVVAVLDEYFRR